MYLLEMATRALAQAPNGSVDPLEKATAGSRSSFASQSLPRKTLATAALRPVSSSRSPRLSCSEPSRSPRLSPRSGSPRLACREPVLAQESKVRAMVQQMDRMKPQQRSAQNVRSIISRGESCLVRSGPAMRQSSLESSIRSGPAKRQTSLDSSVLSGSAKRQTSLDSSFRGFRVK